jgi:hypothetical protein
MPTREDVFKAIDSERDYQQACWPGHKHPVGSYLTYMTDYLANAVLVDSHTDAKDCQALEDVRKFATLGVVCMEEHGYVDLAYNLVPGPCPRDEVYTIIEAERNRQDQKWPAYHETSEELTLLRHYMRQADEAWAVNHGDNEALNEVRKAVAVAVRCMEKHGAPLRLTKMPSQVL